jgi:hypothetical protein
MEWIFCIRIEEVQAFLLRVISPHSIIFKIMPVNKIKNNIYAENTLSESVIYFICLNPKENNCTSPRNCRTDNKLRRILLIYGVLVELQNPVRN